MICPKCGKEIADKSRFCKYCGSKLDGNQVNKENNDDDRPKKIIIGVLLVIIVVLLAVFVSYGLGLFSGNDSPSDTPSEIVAEQPVSLSSFPVSRAPQLAQVVKSSNGVFPVEFESLTLSKAQCAYILTKSIVEISNGNTNGFISVNNPSYASSPAGRDSSQAIASSNYIDMANRFSSWIDSHNKVPNYIGIYKSGVADVSPSRMMDIAVDVLIQYNNTGKLPASVNI